MVRSQPHFLLFSRTETAPQSGGRWHFILESVDGHTRMEAADQEPGWRRERLELLAVVRGLEALDQPSRVTLVTTSKRISRGFRFGLEEWRANRWRWERDGRWVPIKNRDLWQRVDRALQFHRIECRTWRVDAAHLTAAPSRTAAPIASRNEATRPAHPAWTGLRQRLGEAARQLLTWPGQVDQWSAVT
jgi:ribonuclease HI